MVTNKTFIYHCWIHPPYSIGEYHIMVKKPNLKRIVDSSVGTARRAFKVSRDYVAAHRVPPPESQRELEVQIPISPEEKERFSEYFLPWGVSDKALEAEKQYIHNLVLSKKLSNKAAAGELNNLEEQFERTRAKIITKIINSRTYKLKTGLRNVASGLEGIASEMTDFSGRKIEGIVNSSRNAYNTLFPEPKALDAPYDLEELTDIIGKPESLWSRTEKPSGAFTQITYLDDKGNFRWGITARDNVPKLAYTYSADGSPEMEVHFDEKGRINSMFQGGKQRLKERYNRDSKGNLSAIEHFDNKGRIESIERVAEGRIEQETTFDSEAGTIRVDYYDKVEYYDRDKTGKRRKHPKYVTSETFSADTGELLEMTFLKTYTRYHISLGTLESIVGKTRTSLKSAYQSISNSRVIKYTNSVKIDTPKKIALASLATIITTASAGGIGYGVKKLFFEGKEPSQPLAAIVGKEYEKTPVPLLPVHPLGKETPPPTPTATPEATSTLLPATPTRTSTPRAIPTSIPTSTVMPTPTSTGTPLPTSTHTPTPTATQTPQPTATYTQKPTATYTITPQPTSTAVPTSTPAAAAPTATLTPTATQITALLPKDLVYNFGYEQAKPVVNENLEQIAYLLAEGKDSFGRQASPIAIASGLAAVYEKEGIAKYFVIDRINGAVAVELVNGSAISVFSISESSLDSLVSIFGGGQ